MVENAKERPETAKGKSAGPKPSGAKARAPKAAGARLAGPKLGEKKAKPAKAVPAEAAEAVSRAGAPTFSRKDLVEKLSSASSVKKADLRTVVEATLAAIGQALDRGDDLNLPPLGKVKVNKRREIASGTVLTLKLRRPGAKKETPDAPLADEVD